MHNLSLARTRKIITCVAMALIAGLGMSAVADDDSIAVFNGDFEVVWNNGNDQDDVRHTITGGWGTAGIGAQFSTFVYGDEGAGPASAWIPGWSGPEDIFLAGVILTTPAAWNPDQNDQSIVLYMREGQSVTSDPLPATLEGNTVYTLSVGVGKRLDDEAFTHWDASDYSIELLVDGEAVELIGSNVNPDTGNMDQAVFTYTTPLTVDPDQTLAIRLNTTPAGTKTINFDNITLQAARIPGVGGGD